jgi:hypothetical protein
MYEFPGPSAWQYSTKISSVVLNIGTDVFAFGEAPDAIVP